MSHGSTGSADLGTILDKVRIKIHKFSSTGCSQDYLQIAQCTSITIIAATTRLMEAKDICFVLVFHIYLIGVQ